MAPSDGRTADPAEGLALIQRVQRSLQHHYDLPLPYRVSDFVSHDAQAARRWQGATALPGETLLVHQQGDSLSMTLYLDADLLRRAVLACRPGALDAHTIEPLLDVIEGVSHAVAVLWHAHHARPVGPVALELQAGIDKYVVLTDALQARRQPARAALHDNLFAQRRHLADDYRHAHRLASRYCRWLDTRRRRRGGSRAAELARFYRLPAGAKLARLSRLPGRLGEA